MGHRGISCSFAPPIPSFANLQHGSMNAGPFLVLRSNNLVLMQGERKRGKRHDFYRALLANALNPVTLETMGNAIDACEILANACPLN
jgi:hypothetical protein